MGVGADMNMDETVRLWLLRLSSERKKVGFWSTGRDCKYGVDAGRKKIDTLLGGSISWDGYAKPFSVGWMAESMDESWLEYALALCVCLAYYF